MREEAKNEVNIFIAELPWHEGPLGRSPIGIMGNQRNPSIHFLVVIMASSIGRGPIYTMTRESRKMVVIVQLIGQPRNTALVYSILLWYWTSMLWSIDTCQNRVSADLYHVNISWAQVESSLRSHVFFLSGLLTKCWFLIGSWAFMSGKLVVNRARLFGSGLMLTQDQTDVIDFSCLQTVITALVLCLLRLFKTQNRRPNNIQKSSSSIYLNQVLNNKAQ